MIWTVIFSPAARPGVMVYGDAEVAVTFVPLTITFAAPLEMLITSEADTSIVL